MDYKLPKHFDAARLVLQEKPNEEYPEYIDRAMICYLAPSQTIDVYVGERMYSSQKIEEKEIGVDTARYYFSVDGRDDEIKTGGDGWWGSFEEFYRENGKDRVSDAVALTVAMPGNVNFDRMKELAGYFFEDMQLLPDKEKVKKPKSHER